MVVLNNTTPLDETSAEARRWLPTLQGNILAFHGRRHAEHLFFAFRPEATIAARKATLRALARDYVTSAVEQRSQSDRFVRLRAERARRSATGSRGERLAEEEPFGHLALSAIGYQGLGHDPAALFPDPPDPEGTAVSTFAGGMRATAAADFGDDVGSWEAGYRRDDKLIAGVLILAMSERKALADHVAAARLALEATCDVVVSETGHVVRDPKTGSGIEPFGFLDGRSQPLFRARDFETEPEHPAKWDAFAPLDLVLIRDPLVPSDDRCHGSFLAYRKLDQDVRGFAAALRRFARTLRPRSVARAGALVVGRFADGTALELAGGPQGLREAVNDFDYFDDPHGSRCPFQAHVRKVNPRGSGQEKDKEGHRRRRLTRRGVVYGTEKPLDAATAPLPESGVGLLFMCYQASVRRQFAFVQKTWSHTPTFPRGLVGVDAVIGGKGPRHVYSWPTSWDGNARHEHEFESFVHVLGGEFFFSPSLPFFASL